MRKLAVLPVLAALALTGCAAHQAAPTKPTTYYGESASAIATHIKGCTNVKTGNVGHGTASGLASTASCTLAGRIIDVNSWTNATHGDLAPMMREDKVEAYYATGKGWTVTTRDNPLLQLQILNDAAGLMKAAFANEQMPAQDVPGEKTTANAVVSSLDGHVVHVIPVK